MKTSNKECILAHFSETESNLLGKDFTWYRAGGDKAEVINPDPEERKFKPAWESTFGGHQTS